MTKTQPPKQKLIIDKLLASKVYGQLVYEICAVMLDCMPHEDITLEMILSETHHYVHDVWPQWIWDPHTGYPICSDEEYDIYTTNIRKGKQLMKKYDYHFNGKYPHLEYMDKM